ncbi:MAG: biotin transporter BioY [Cryobacterium sp.]|jgi:biotin transport system substrate-specific component|nr:biotin transporter BioY [Cryobacterium sp.]
MTPRFLTARDLAQIAIFAALIAALGLPGALSVGAVAVPITFQTLGVMLAGAILGARKGFLAVLLLLALAAAGLPLLSGGRGGLVWFTTSPAAGYPYGWLLGAALIGFLTSRLLPKYRFWPALGATVLGGIVVVYAIGIPVTAINLGLPLWAAAIDSVKFLPGDLLKAVVTVLVARQVHIAYPGLISRVQREPKLDTVRG